jgi:single-stranded DNA-specific DHH superfamily exonuclease
MNAYYHVDGFTSSCILSRACEGLQMRPVVLCRRGLANSYGANLARIRASQAAERFSSVICVDCGGLQFREVKRVCTSNRYPVLVLDHHRPG